MIFCMKGITSNRSGDYTKNRATYLWRVDKVFLSITEPCRQVPFRRQYICSLPYRCLLDASFLSISADSFMNIEPPSNTQPPTNPTESLVYSITCILYNCPYYSTLNNLFYSSTSCYFTLKTILKKLCVIKRGLC